MQTYHQKCGQTGKVFAGARYLMITLLIGCVVSLPTTALARGKGQNFTRTYVGTIDGAPIRMKLQRRGEILSGTYAYVRAGVTLHLQGVTDGDHLKLIEIYGKNARTGVIEGHFTADGAIQGTWTKPDGAGALRFRAQPAGKISESRSSLPRLDRDFLQAVKRADTRRAWDLLNRGARVNARDEEGRTALALAATFHTDALDGPPFKNLQERLMFVKLLLANDADVNARNQSGFTPLMYAVASRGEGNGIVRLLLERGANVNVRNNYGGTALMVATGNYGDPSTLEILLKAGARVNVRDHGGRSALWWARDHHATEDVVLLRRAGATE